MPSDLLPHLIDDPAIEIMRERDRELATEIADLLQKLTVARALRDQLVDLMTRMQKKNRTPRRRIEKPDPPTSSATAEPPPATDEARPTVSPFAPVIVATSEDLAS